MSSCLILLRLDLLSGPFEVEGDVSEDSVGVEDCTRLFRETSLEWEVFIFLCTCSSTWKSGVTGLACFFGDLLGDASVVSQSWISFFFSFRLACRSALVSLSSLGISKERNETSRRTPRKVQTEVLDQRRRSPLEQLMQLLADPAPSSVKLSRFKSVDKCCYDVD